METRPIAPSLRGTVTRGMAACLRHAPPFPPLTPYTEADRPEQMNDKALQVVERVRRKLTGRDFKPNVTLDVKEQVEELVSQATNVENLCVAFVGWCSFCPLFTRFECPERLADVPQGDFELESGRKLLEGGFWWSNGSKFLLPQFTDRDKIAVFVSIYHACIQSLGLLGPVASVLEAGMPHVGFQ